MECCSRFISCNAVQALHKELNTNWIVWCVTISPCLVQLLILYNKIASWFHAAECVETQKRDVQVRRHLKERVSKICLTYFLVTKTCINRLSCCSTIRLWCHLLVTYSVFSLCTGSFCQIKPWSSRLPNAASPTDIYILLPQSMFRLFFCSLLKSSFVRTF